MKPIMEPLTFLGGFTVNKKKLVIFSLAGVLSLTAVGAIAQLDATGNLKFRAADSTTWKHFSAIMPTDTSKGIREYWTDCVGGAPRFSAPEGISAPDATLTEEQKAYILGNPGDERVIPTLAEINASVAKGYDGTSPYQGNDVTNAYAYTYLDDVTKAQITGADATKITTAYETYNKYYSVLVDADGLNQYADTVTSVESNATYGKVLKVNASTDYTGEGWTAGPGRNTELVKEGVSAIRFAIYAPQPMNVTFINGACTKWFVASTGKVVSTTEMTEGSAATTFSGGDWKEFTIPASAINDLGDLYIRLYLKTSSSASYGIPRLEDSLGSAYVSQIYGIKDAYYIPEANKFDEVVAKISSISNPTKADAYYIYEANKIYETLSGTVKALCTRVDDFNTAKVNCAYALAAPMDASSFPYSGSWAQNATATDIVDEAVGKAMKITLNDAAQQNSAIESCFNSVAVDSSAYDMVSFSIKSDWNGNFCFSKANWWTNAYDFSAKDWITSGANVTYRTDSTAGWTDVTMPLSDFNECKYFSFFIPASPTGKSLYISAIYAYKAA